MVLKEEKYSNSKKVLTNGIDRVDNDKGYVRGNIVPCCTNCNIAKNTFLITEFEEWINRVYEHLKNKKGE